MTLSRRQLERTDLTVEIEQGRRVEQGLFRENTRSMNTLGDLLNQRHFSKREDVREWQRRKDYAPQVRVTPVGPNPHGIECPCDRCHEGVLRLLRDCGVLPKGLSDFASFVLDGEPQQLKVPARYRRDESDR